MADPWLAWLHAGIDSSAPVVELAAQNAQLNGYQDTCSFVKADIHRFMQEADAEERQWDIIVLDPPKLAPSRKSLERARSKYKALNRLAIRLVKPGGMLTTCTCSGAMTQSGTFTRCEPFRWSNDDADCKLIAN